MCVGIPMRIVEMTEGAAICEARGARERVDMQLVGEQAPGTWVLTFLGTAREVLSESAAMQINQAIEALELIAGGETNVDHLFADLIDREIEPPPSMVHAKREHP